MVVPRDVEAVSDAGEVGNRGPREPGRHGSTEDAQAGVQDLDKEHTMNKDHN